MARGATLLPLCILALGLAVTGGGGVSGAADAGQASSFVLAQGSRAPAFERNWDARTRRTVQQALIWTGDYDARIDGAVGPRTRQAIRDFQRRQGFPATGYLTGRQFDVLLEAGRAAVEAAGFRIVEDPETGIRVGLPEALLARSHRDGPTIVYRPLSGSGITSLALISMRGGESELDELFEVLAARGIVEADAYTVLRDDFLVVSDEKGGTVTYTYVEATGGALKGFTLAWPEERMETFAPIATAMFNSFEPIPGVLD